jgi:hypothetical protein
MTFTFAGILLWLLALDLGIAFGAGLYEHRIVVPQWFSCSQESGLRVNSKAMQQMDVGRKFWSFVTTVPLTILTVASVLVAPFHSWIFSSLRLRGGAVRFWWLTATTFALLDRIATFSFFIPTALKLMRADSLPPSRAAQMATLWIRMNWIRLTLLLAAWLAALKALSLLHAVAYSLRMSFGPGTN